MKSGFRKIQIGILIAAWMVHSIPAGADTALSAASSAPADVPTAVTTLDELLREAEKNNPMIRSSKAKWQASKKLILSSWALANPMIGFDLMGEMTETRVGPQENRLEVVQQIPFPLKLWTRRQAAKREAAAAYHRFRAVRRDVLFSVRQAYYDLHWSDQTLETIAEIKNLLKKWEGVAESRFANKSGSQRDAAKAQAEVSMTLEQEFMFRQKRESAAAKLKALLDRNPLNEMSVSERPGKPEVKETFAEIMNRAAQNRAEIQEMEAEAEKAKQEKKLAMMEYIPDLTTGFEYTQVGSGMTADPEDGKDSWMFPLRFEVPLWQNRMIPEIQVARKNVEAAEAELKGARNETFYEVKDSFLKFKTAEQIVLLYETAVIPQAKIALSSDEAGYEGGGVGFLELLDSERVYLNAKLAYHRLTRELMQSYADLVRVSGLDLEGEKS